MSEPVMEPAVQKVSINDIKPGMVLARDVVTASGTVLLAKNTMLNNINYNKLLTSGVDHIYAVTGSIDDNTANFTEKERLSASLEHQCIPVEKRPDFIAFQTAVDEKTAEAKEQIRKISVGGNIDLNILYSLTDDIIGKLRYKNDILTYIGFIKESDEHTYHHSVNVSLLCSLYARWIALPQKELLELTTAGMLHDIGKTRIPDEILNKKGKLTDDEFTVMKKHPIFGYRIVENQEIPDTIKTGVLMHHEKLDGSGYPLGLKDDRIGKLAKIIAICDIYEAMTSNRVYRKKICPFEVIRTFETKVYGELDTQSLLVFLNNIAYTYVGSWVRLSDGSVAEVVFINGAQLSRPIVRTVDGQFINLSINKDISIDSLV